ncbi:sugar ABC transporter ATP-binding protein [Actinoallomurus spadix]|uniref:Sugar ABC transporter ATP-binding protein n=1 Tax=Actinoallomurus spadix TaxID=79912 RepID=A0ABN0WYA9_9ACTN|nr:sugar ABC transporter ATP-binding protein [Actinoallomurus spadix]MCO5989641.1 sugar ABC transporter ATP-binding protein [Actinoallomurus spadix]
MASNNDRPVARGAGSERGSDPVARTRGAVRRYPGVLALDHVDFEVHPGEVRALLGKNGAGKSTLIRLLSGVEKADEGTVEIAGTALTGGGSREASQLGVATVYQELSLIPQLSVAENYHLGALPTGRGGLVRTAHMKDAADAALAELGVRVDPGTPVGALPVAEQQMVEIARALRGSPKLLILDEPTSSLAAAAVDVVLQAVTRIAATGVAIIYVSHRLNEIRQIADTASVMRDGRLVETVGTKGASSDDIVSLMLGDAASATEATARRTSAPATDRPVVLSVRELAVPPKVREATFDLHEGEILGIAGVLGSGRSELLRSIAGLQPPASGTLTVFGERLRRWSVRDMIRRGVGFTPEERKTDGIVPLLGVDENIVLADRSSVRRGPLLSGRRQRAAAAKLVSALSVRTPDVGVPVGALSGGNQQKAVIARWLHRGSRILLLDEPTRGVDVQAKAQIYELVRKLADDGVSIVFVSNELEELPLVCSRVVVLRDGAIAAELTGADITESAIFAATLADGTGSAAASTTGESQ